MKFKSVVVLLILTAFCVNAQEKTFKKEDLKTRIQKVSYSIGHDLGKTFKMQEMDVALQELFQGIKDGINDEALFTEDEMANIVVSYQEDMFAKREAENKAMCDKNRKEGDDFLAANKLKEGVLTTSTGLQYKIIKQGSGEKPVDTSKVKVHYRGYFIDGKEFDSSYKRNEPTTFPVLNVIPGWTEALKLMSVGDKWELYIPYNLAYGESGSKPVIEPCKTLLFEVELLEIVK